MSNRNPPCIIYIAFFSSYSPEYSPLQLSQPYSPPNVSKALFLHIILFLPVDQEHQQRTTWNTGSVDRAALDQISNRFVADLVTPLDQLTPRPRILKIRWRLTEKEVQPNTSFCFISKIVHTNHTMYIKLTNLILNCWYLQFTYNIKNLKI